MEQEKNILSFPYSYKSIISGENINYGAFKIKHQKKLIELYEEIEDKETNADEMSFVELVEKMCLDLIDIAPNRLFYSDFEYLIFLIRTKSYGEKIQYIKTIKNPVTNEFEQIPLIFNINTDIKIKGEQGLREKSVPMVNGDILIISPLYYKEYMEIYKTNKIHKNQINFDIIFNSMRKVIKKDNEAIEFSDFNSKSEYFENLEIEDFKNIKIAFSDFPRIDVVKEDEITTDGGTKIKIKTNFGDMTTSFFVLS